MRVACLNIAAIADIFCIGLSCALLLMIREIRKFATLIWLGMALCIVLFSSTDILAQPLQRPVPFKLPGRDTTFSQYLPLGNEMPSGKHGALNLDSNGHIIAKDGTRLKFFGTELDYTVNFLSQKDCHDLALRLHKLGFNAVRLAYNDYYGWDASSFFSVYDSAGNFQATSYHNYPLHFAMFDTMLYEFKQAGIYTFLTLNSAHQFGTGDNIPGIDSTNTYHYFFARYTEPQAAQLEREWVRTLMTHVNPLTKLEVSQDPSIAVAEISWQNTLNYYWTANQLIYVDSNNVNGKGTSTVSYFQSRQFDTLYNTYLKHKYGSDAALNFAWQGNPNPSKANLLDNGSFEDPSSNAWSFQVASTTRASIVDADGGVDSATYKKIRITDVGASPAYGNIYFENTSPYTTLGKDSLYEITFWAKMPYAAARPAQLTRQIYLYINSYIGGSPTNAATYITIDTTWRQYRYTFRAWQPGVQAIYFFVGNSLGDLWLDACTLHHTAELGLLSGESLNTATVIRFKPADIGAFSFQRVRDQMMFTDSLELAYYTSISKLIKDTLHFQGLVNYTQQNYWGTSLDQYVSSFGDVSEGVVGWDYMYARANQALTDSTWQIQNISELRSTYAGNFGYYIPANSTAGKAFIATVGFPNMNQSIAEQMLLVPTYAAYQDWDGVFFEMWATQPPEPFADHNLNYFTSESYHYYSLANISSVLALAPTASHMFRNGYVHAAGVSQTVVHDPDDVWLSPLYGRAPWGVDGNLDPNIITGLKVRQQFNSSAHRVAAQYAYVPDTSVKQSDDGAILWDQTNGILTIGEDKVNGAAGLIGTDTFALPNIKFARKNNTRDMFTLYYESEDSLALDSSVRSIVTISPRVQNTAEYWVDSVGFSYHWGTAPMLMNAEQVNLMIKSQYDSVLIYPLDSMGRLLQLPIADGFYTAEIIAQQVDTSRWFAATIDQKVYPSVWYYVLKKNATLGVAEKQSEPDRITLAPNPANANAEITINAPKSEVVSVSIVDDLGREIQSVAKSMLIQSTKTFTINTSSMAIGHYIVRITTPTQNIVRSLNVIR
jgi:hypothetical protein